MSKQRGFQSDKKKIKKDLILIKFFKGSILGVIFLTLASFFYSTNEIIYADKVNFLSKILSGNLQTLYQNNFPAIIGKLFVDYEKGKNILKQDKAGILLALNKSDIIVQILGLSEYKQTINQIKNIILSSFNEVLKLLGENQPKTYLIIFENTSEQRGIGGFFGSFAKITLSGGHIKDFKIFDSYYLLWKYCKEHTKNLPKKGWFDACNKSGLNINNNIKPFNKLFPKTTFLASNIFGFDNLNGENIINHYHKVFSDKIDGVIFVRSDILKYLFPNGKKILRDLEIINYKAKLKKYPIKSNNPNLKGLKGVKGKYLLELNKLLKSKKEIFKNFIKNFDKIKKERLIGIYISQASGKLKKQLAENNLYFTQNKNFSYLFFFNLGFNKNSKFVDHIVKINNKVLINPVKFKLQKGINSIEIKNVFIPHFFYEEYLKKNNIPKNSYLWSNSLKYKNIFIPQQNCEIINQTNNYYQVLCK